MEDFDLRISLTDLIKNLMVSTAYMGAVFSVGIIGITILSWIIPVDPNTISGFLTVVIVFVMVGAIYFGLNLNRFNKKG